MSNANLSPSSYVILGLLATCGPLTSYELKKQVDGSVGYFWSFPRAQLYVEPERLTSLGYLTEEREQEGRRRRTYAITPAGRDVLQEWLSAETPQVTELHDAGLLKLFFASELRAEQIADLARQQEAAHRRRLAEYEAITAQIQAHIESEPQAEFGLATLRMGTLYERMSIEFWRDIASAPPRLGANSSTGVVSRAARAQPSGAWYSSSRLRRLSTRERAYIAVREGLCVWDSILAIGARAGRMAWRWRRKPSGWDLTPSGPPRRMAPTPSRR